MQMNTPPRSQFVEGWHLPDTETHFPAMFKGHNRRAGGPRKGRACYQVHKLDLAMDATRRRRRAIDVGAHVGLWSYWLADLFEAVEAFEPVQWFYDIFPANVPQENVSLRKCALGAEPGAVELTTNPAFTGGTHITGAGKSPMRTLDSFGFRDVDFVKIDVEGYELSVCEGAQKTFVREKPTIIVEQKGNDLETYGGAKNEAQRFIESLGARMVKDVGGDVILRWNE